MKQILAGFLILVLFTVTVQSAAAAARPAPNLEAGKQAFLDNCVRCHGVTGAGDGRDATKMFPMPRVLADGVFKFRSTASGTPPTDEDLFRTISEGLPGSRMPEFQRLSEETRWQLVEYVKSLSTVFKEQKPEPIALGEDPGPQKVSIAHGKELYTQLGCNACHGNLGRGDGPSALTLTDQWNNPIRAADLTQGERYRAGSDPREILTRLMTGLDGAPMPSYVEATTPAEAWSLAYYVHSIQVRPNWSRTVQAVTAGGSLPSDPADSSWNSAPRSDLRLASSYYREGKVLPTTVKAVSVQAFTRGNEMALRLSWHDPSSNKEAPADALALAFLPDRRLKWKVGSLRGWPVLPAAMQEHDGTPALTVAYWSANRNAAEAGTIRDIIDLSGHPGSGRSLPANASFADGEWILVLRCPLEPQEKSLRFGIMVWDGDNAEQGRHRANSQWVELVFNT